MKIKHKKLKIKKVFIFATLALCIGIFAFWKFSQPAVASWFNDSWAYRQAVTVTVTSSASDLTNFPVNITVNTSALISSKLQSDCDDLRFTNANGDLLPYYINSGCNTTSTKIWIMTDLIPKNSTTFTIYMYYGNPSATAGSTTNYGLNLYQGLIGYWNMNETSWTGDCSTATVKDLSGSGLNGKACPNASAPTITSSGKYGNGGSFDGTNDYVQTTSNLNVNFANITISTWFNSLDVTTTRRILEHDWDAGGVFGFHQQTGTAHAVLRNANGDQMGDIDYGTVSTGTWYNLVQTYDGHTWIGYLNGVYVDSIIDSTGLLQYSGVLYLGSINYPYRGTLDETRVYNRALSSTEVAQLYNDSTSPILTSTQGIVVPSTAFAAEEKTPGPIAYWKFNDGQGTNAQDSTTNNADGTLAGTTKPTWQTEDQCVSEKCLFFEGTTANVTVASAINGVQSVSMWVRPITTASTVLIDLDGGTHTITTNGSSVISATGFTSPTYYINGVQQTTPTLTANTWQFITVTTGTGFNSTSSLTIGKTGTTYFKGFIDDVKIYNYARTAAQVKTDFAARGSVKGVSAQMGGADQAYLSNGLVGYWKMDESSGNAVDSSGNGLTLTNNSTAVYGTGKFGNGITGDGTADYLNTATAINGIKTVSFWAYTPDTTNYFLNLINSSAYITSTTGTISATGFTSPSIYVNGVLNGTISANTWTHIVITTNTGINANAFAIGLTNDGSNHFLTNTSKIDEARVYNRALSPKEAADLFNFAPGPVGYWKMDEGSGATINDISGNTYTGTWQGSTGTHWTNGKFGKATNFNGSSTSTGTGDYISTTLTMPTVGSITFWYKATTATADNRIFGAEAATTGVDGVGLSANLGGNLYAIFRNNSTSGDIDSGSAASTTVFEHIGMTWGADGTKLYRNGVLVGSSTAITSITTGSLTLNLGACGSGTCYRYNGLLDDVKVYNYVRTQKQIVSDMNADHPSVGSPVGSSVAYWDFDEGNSTIAHDLIPNANNLTLSTASWTDSGKFGKAWNGLGTNWLSIADDADFDVSATDDYTISLWFKSDSANNPGATEYLVDKGPIKASSAGYAIYANTDGTVCFAIDDDTTWDPDVVSCSPTDIYDGTWHHLVAVRDHTNTDKTILYVDAVLKDSDSDTTTATLANAQILYIGDSNGVDGGDEFNGDLDEIKVYRFTLTSSEVKIDFNRSQSIQLGAAGNNSTYQTQASNQEYCVPGDATACLPPIGRWDFEEGKDNTCSGGFNDICDTSTNGKDGTNTSATWTSGKYGKGMYYGGTSNSLGFGNNFNITASDNLTWEVWFKTDGQNRSVRRGIGGKKFSENSNTAGYWSSIWTNGILETVISNATTQITLTSTNAVDDSKWHHLVVQINRTTGNSQMYLDGKLEDTDTTPSGDLSNAVNYCYGSICINSGVFPFKGTMDQAMIFNYVRTPAQIAWDYNKSKPLAYWDFDECEGDIVHDLSGNNYSATITIGGTGDITQAGTCTDGLSTSAWYAGRNGKFNSALALNNGSSTDNDYAAVDNDLSVQGWTAMTISAWINANNFARTDNMIVSKAYTQDSGPANTAFVLKTDSSGYPIFGISTNSYSGGWFTTVTSSKSISTGSWHLLTGVWNGTNYYLYLDGVQTASGSRSGTMSNNALRLLTFGNYSDLHSTSYFNGQIDDVKIWNYALTATQVKNEYNGGALNYAPTTGSP